MFDKFADFKEYASNRSKFRFIGMGVDNARITKLSSGMLKGVIKQYDNQKSNITIEMYNLVKKELEFRQVCLNLKSVFDIKIK
jgi:hypothetical protein